MTAHDHGLCGLNASPCDQCNLAPGDPLGDSVPQDDVAERAKAALASVTAVPWVLESDYDHMSNSTTYRLVDVERFREYANSVHFGEDEDLARFVRDAHNTLIPELVAEIERLRKYTQAMAGQLDLWLRGHPLTEARKSDVSALVREVSGE